MISTRQVCTCTLAIALLAAPSLARAGSLTIAWDPNSETDLAGYLVHYGTQPGVYSHVLDVGATTAAVIPNLTEGQRIYVAVKAYSDAGLESGFSAETSGVVAAPAPTTGLVAAYGFDESSGTTVLDASGRGNTGTVSGATRTASGRYGRALSFDGINDLVTVSDSASLDLGAGMTIEAWVNPSALSGWRTAVMKEDVDGLAYALYANDNAPQAAAYARMACNTASDSVATTTQLPLNTWTHVAGTYDGTALRLYVNGTLVSTRPAAGAIVATANPLRVGGNSVWGEYFAGRIDEVRIYNRALAAADIGRDMNAPVVSGLVAAYGFEEASGASVLDASAHRNTGSIAGATRTASGRFGRALSFDGVDDSVTIVDAPVLDLSTGMTLEAWVNPRALSGWRTVLMKESADGLAYALYAHDNAPRSAAYVRVAGSGGDESAAGSTALPLDTWTHLAATFDGAHVRLYVNGALVGTRAVAGTLLVTSRPLRIGSNLVWGEYFNGRLDEIRVYNRALSAAEIRADMARPVVP
jgi:hypothetical protein